MLTNSSHPKNSSKIVVAHFVTWPNLESWRRHMRRITRKPKSIRPGDSIMANCSRRTVADSERCVNGSFRITFVDGTSINVCGAFTINVWR